MDSMTLQKINEPTFITDLCDHVTQGGGLPNLCQHLKIKYSDVIRWIYKNPDLAKQYEAALQARQQWFIQSILNELKDIAFADLREAYDENGNLLPPNLMPPNIAKVMQAIETEELYEGQGANRENVGTSKRIKSWDKLRALELLGKNLSMFKEQVEHSGELTLEQLVLGSLKTQEAPCLPALKAAITLPPTENLPVELSKEPDSSSSGKTDPLVTDQPASSPTEHLLKP